MKKKYDSNNKKRNGSEEFGICKKLHSYAVTIKATSHAEAFD